MNGRARLAATLGLALLVTATCSFSAFAEPAERGASVREELERPWAKDVDPEQQQRALQLFQEGNGLFTESQYAAALARYREALRLWKHPAIHYNAAVSLINLENPLAAYEQIEAALAFGEAPLGSENHRQAELYRKLLSAQLAELEVTCAQPDVQITLDGTTLFLAPGSARQRLAPGAHQLVARKPGLVTETHALDLPAGKLTRTALALSPPSAPRLQSVRRWAVWKPWAVLGSGVALGLVGVPLFISARQNFETYDAEIARLCPTGCDADDLPSTVVDARERGRLQNGLAVGMFAAGGAIAATGVALVILNQPRLQPLERSGAFALTPLVGPRSAGLEATVRY